MSEVNGDGKSHVNAHVTTLILEIAAFVTAVLVLAWLKTSGLLFQTASPAAGANFGFDPSYVISRFTPVLLTAACIERAVEVLVSPWRDAGAGQLAVDLKTAQLVATQLVATQDAGQNQNAVVTHSEAAKALHAYRGDTQQLAFLVSLILGLLASVAGIRVLDPFLAPGALNGLSWGQSILFASFDVILTATLLSGGADGMHSVVNAFTSFFEATSRRNSGV